MHLQHSHESIPDGIEPQPVHVWRLTPASPKAGGMVCSAAAVRPKAFPIQKQLSVKLTRPPCRQHLAYRCLINLQQAGDGAEIRSEADDAADIEVPVGPAIQPMTYTRRQGVVHRRMAQRTLNPDRLQTKPRLELAFETDYRVEFEQFECDSGIVEIHPAGAQVTLQRIRQRIHVNFQADLESRLWTDTAADSAKTGSLDRAVQLQRATPEGFCRTCRIGI